MTELMNVSMDASFHPRAGSAAEERHLGAALSRVCNQGPLRAGAEARPEKITFTRP